LGLTRLRAFLRRHNRIALDTSIFIYQVEANPRYQFLTDRLFAWIEEPGHSAITSTITMTELLVHPYREDDEQLVDQFYGLFSAYPNLDWILPDLEVADNAARLRAAHNLRTPNALLAACAIKARATALVSNDQIFARVPGLEILTLDQLLPVS
jgi:predicted nucleic acid-binding protein